MTDLATLLPQQSIANGVPQSFQTSGDGVTSQLVPTALPALAPISALPGYQIVLDPADLRQPFYGVGAALTDSTCYLLTKYCTPAQRRAILQKVFGSDGFNMIRLCMGSSDFSARPTTIWPYDLTQAATYDVEYIIPVVLECLAINPRLKIFASPWSPPAAQKNNNSMIGGQLVSSPNFATYAAQFRAWIRLYKSYGISIFAVTTQNEGNYNTSGGSHPYPGCQFTGAQADSFAQALGAEFDAPTDGGPGIETQIWVGDVNWTEAAQYSGDLIATPLGDAATSPYISGVAWHGYDNYTSAERALDQLRKVRPYPGKLTHFTEWSTFFSDNPARILQMGATSILIDAVRKGASSITFWNLFLDANGNPTAATSNLRGCAVLSTDGQANVTLNPEYLLLASIGRMVKPGARVCACTTYAKSAVEYDLQAVGFANPDGSRAAFLYNNAASSRTATIVDGATGLATILTLAAGSNSVAEANLSGQNAKGGGSGVCMASIGYTPPPALAATGAITAPGPVTNLQGSSQNGQSALTWTAPANTGSGTLGGYAILRGSASQGETQTVGVALPGATSFTDFDVVVNTTYFYKVVPFGAGGLSPEPNPECSVTPQNSAPSQPQVTAYPGPQSVAIQLTNGPPANGGSAITGYTIYRGTSQGQEGSTPIATNVALPYTDTSVSASTAYYYTVAAVNSVGTGPVSSEVSTTTGAAVSDPGAGLLVSEDIGGNASSAANGWCATSFTFSPSTVAISNHNNVLGPDNTNKSASTLTFTATSASNGYASVECQTSANIGTASHTASFWARGHQGGEQIQLYLADSSHANGTVNSPTVVTLTPAWKQYTVTTSVSSGGSKPGLMQIGTPSKFVGTVVFDVDWGNVT